MTFLRPRGPLSSVSVIGMFIRVGSQAFTRPGLPGHRKPEPGFHKSSQSPTFRPSVKSSYGRTSNRKSAYHFHSSLTNHGTKNRSGAPRSLQITAHQRRHRALPQRFRQLPHHIPFIVFPTPLSDVTKDFSVHPKDFFVPFHQFLLSSSVNRLQIHQRIELYCPGSRNTASALFKFLGSWPLMAPYLCECIFSKSVSASW